MAGELGASRQPGVLDRRQSGRHQPVQDVAALRVPGGLGEVGGGVGVTLAHQQPGEHRQRLPPDHARVALPVEHLAQSADSLGPPALHPEPAVAAGAEHVRMHLELAVGAVGLPVRDEPHRLVVLAEPPEALGEVVVGPHDELVVGHVLCLVPAAQQVVTATQVAELQPGRPEVVGGEGHDVVGTQALCQVDPGLQRMHPLVLLVDQDENAAQVEPGQGLVEGVARSVCQLKGKLGR